MIRTHSIAEKSTTINFSISSSSFLLSRFSINFIARTHTQNKMKNVTCINLLTWTFRFQKSAKLLLLLAMKKFRQWTKKRRRGDFIHLWHDRMLQVIIFIGKHFRAQLYDAKKDYWRWFERNFNNFYDIQRNVFKVVARKLNFHLHSPSAGDWKFSSRYQLRWAAMESNKLIQKLIT